MAVDDRETTLRKARSMVNRAWREYEYHTGKTALRGMPDLFAIESTNYCNLKCIMCPRGEPDLMERKLGSMTDDVFKKTIDGWEYFAEPVWLHLFGEPLMHPRLFDQIEYARSVGVPNVGISTNATLLTKMNAAKLLDSGLDTIILSVDGHDKATYEKIRKSPAFTYEEVFANVSAFLELRRRMRRTKPHTIVQIIVMQENRAALDAFKTRWETAGADEVRFKKYTAWGNQADHGTFAELALDEAKARLRELSPRAHPCYYMWSSVVVTWDGRVVPCCFDYDAVAAMGDLRTQTLAEIWNGEKYQALRAAELAGTNDNALCRNCVEAPGFARDPSQPPPPADVSAFGGVVHQPVDSGLALGI